MKEKFAIIDDPRHQGYVEHKLTDIRVIVQFLLSINCRAGRGLAVRRNRVNFGRDKFTGYVLRHSLMP